MAGITVDIKKMRGTVKPEISKSVSDLNSAVNIISGAKIPKTFTAGVKIKSYNNQIQDVIKTLNSVSSWIDKVANKFEKAEAENKLLVTYLIEELNSLGTKASSELLTEFMATVKDIEELNNLRTEASSELLTEFMDIVKDEEKFGKFLKSVIGSWFIGVEEGKQSVGCDIANCGINFVYNAAKSGEGIVDAGVTIGSEVVSCLFEGPEYIASSVVSKITGMPRKETLVEKVRKDTMSFVAEDHVGNLYRDFYKSKTGQYLDQNAHSMFKSDGRGTQSIGSFGNKVIPLLGGALTGFASVGTVISISSQAGIYLEEYYADKENKSWIGIEKQYKNGIIDKKTYENYSNIRKISDKDWNKITQKYKNGNMPKDEYQQLKNIREMPQDWRDGSTVAKGSLYAATNCLWDYGKGKAASFISRRLDFSESVSDFLNIGVNAMDVPYKAGIDTIFYGKDYEQAFEEHGGWKNILMDLFENLETYEKGVLEKMQI